jgi:putative transposase
MVTSVRSQKSYDHRFKKFVVGCDVTFSNSMIEAWWRMLKHNWLYLNTLDNIEAVRKLTDFYVQQHNQVIPHSAFKDQTPDEVYLGKDGTVVEELISARQAARTARQAANRAMSCSKCKPEAELVQLTGPLANTG